MPLATGIECPSAPALSEACGNVLGTFDPMALTSCREVTLSRGKFSCRKERSREKGSGHQPSPGGFCRQPAPCLQSARQEFRELSVPPVAPPQARAHSCQGLERDRAGSGPTGAPGRSLTLGLLRLESKAHV